jgi:hypothetical protein
VAYVAIVADELLAKICVEHFIQQYVWQDRYMLLVTVVRIV